LPGACTQEIEQARRSVARWIVIALQNAIGLVGRIADAGFFR
jgi:hypothetical protein